MSKQRRFLPVTAASMALAGGIAVSLTGADPAIAQGVLRPVEALIVNTPATPVPVTVVGTRTHLGVPLADHVMLAGAGQSAECGSAKAFRRMQPDGTPADVPFTVPAGRSLVVLDVDAVIVGRNSGTFPIGTTVLATIMPPSQVQTGVFMFQMTSGVTITTAGTFAVAVSSTLGAGAVFGAGQQVCMRGDIRTFGGGFLDGVVTNAMVRGYLI